MTVSREAGMSALLTLVTGAYAWGSLPTRRLVLWDDVPKALRPAAFLFGGGGQNYTWTNLAVPKRIKLVDFIVYIDGSNPTTTGDVQIDNILDAMDAAMKPQGKDVTTGRNTLGGTVYDCRFAATDIRTTPGDIDGDGMIWGKIQLTFP